MTKAYLRWSVEVISPLQVFLFFICLFCFLSPHSALTALLICRWWFPGLPTMPDHARTQSCAASCCWLRAPVQNADRLPHWPLICWCCAWLMLSETTLKVTWVGMLEATVSTPCSYLLRAKQLHDLDRSCPCPSLPHHWICSFQDFFSFFPSFLYFQPSFQII